MQNKLEFQLTELINYIYKDTILPELFEIIGEEETLKLIQIFGGMSIKIPSYKKILDLKRNIEIYETLAYASSSSSVKLLAQKYNITEIWVCNICRMMRLEYPKIQKFLKENSKDTVVTITTRRNPRNVKSISEKL